MPLMTVSKHVLIAQYSAISMRSAILCNYGGDIVDLLKIFVNAIRNDAKN